MREKYQSINYCGVNANWQNDRAEKRIRDLAEGGRKQLLHAKVRWSRAITLNVWPYALRMENQLHNNIVNRKTKESPLERFCGIKVENNLNKAHTFGYPVYVYIIPHSSIPKWNPLARLGVNLGPSPNHARSVSLILNLTTGLVSPKFHINRNEIFETVRPAATNETTTSLWKRLSGFTRGKMKIPEGGQSNVIDEFQQLHTTTEINPINPNIPAENDLSRNLHEDEIAIVVTNTGELEIQPPDMIIPTLSTGTRRSTRQQTPTQAFLNNVSQEHLIFSAFLDKGYTEDYLIQESMENPVAFKALTDLDTLYYQEAMAASDTDNFVEAIIKEVNTQCERDHWELILKENIPNNKNILDSVWAMKEKRDIKTRKVCKWKARLNIHGGQQELGGGGGITSKHTHR